MAAHYFAAIDSIPSAACDTRNMEAGDFALAIGVGDDYRISTGSARGSLVYGLFLRRTAAVR